MSLLSPGPAILAAAITVPLLVLLYMLRLRRRPLRIPSTILWITSTADLVANAPFRRPRWSMLLLLQLIALLLLLAALARPARESPDLATGRTIVLVDRSASMRAPAAAPDAVAAATRLDLARAEVQRLVEEIARTEGGELMLIGFAAQAEVLCGFESDRRRLREALDGLTPTDEEADLDAALALADAFARTGDTATGGLPTVVLLSDGGVRPSERTGGFAVQAARFRQVAPPSGGSPRNLGIVGITAERRYDDPARVEVFLRVASAQPVAADTNLTIRRDGEVVLSRPLSVPAADATGPGEATLTATIEAPGSTTILASLTAGDELSADDDAAVALPAPRTLRLALLAPNGEPDPFLRELLEATDPEELAIGGPEFAADRDLSAFDLLVLDRVALPALPSIPSLTFGAAPPNVSERAPAALGGRRLLAWERRHPLLRHVPLDGLVYARFGGFELPEDAEVLATGSDGPVMAVLTQRGVRHAFIGFALRQSNLPVLPGFPVLMQNALDYLGAAGAGMVGAWLKTGAPFGVDAQPGTAQVAVRSIDGERAVATTDVRPGQARIALPGIASAGIYRIEGGTPALVTVNVASTVETDIRIRPDLAVAVSGGGERAVPVLLQRDLWPWFAWGLIVLLTGEWTVYLWRARSR